MLEPWPVAATFRANHGAGHAPQSIALPQPSPVGPQARCCSSHGWGTQGGGGGRGSTEQGPSAPPVPHSETRPRIRRLARRTKGLAPRTSWGRTRSSAIGRCCLPASAIPTPATVAGCLARAALKNTSAAVGVRTAAISEGGARGGNARRPGVRGGHGRGPASTKPVAAAIGGRRARPAVEDSTPAVPVRPALVARFLACPRLAGRRAVGRSVRAGSDRHSGRPHVACRRAVGCGGRGAGLPHAEARVQAGVRG